MIPDDQKTNLKIMNCQELASRIQKLQPEAPMQDVARLCLLLSNNTNSLDLLGEPSALKQAWHDTGLKLQIATDQHAAMTEEIET